MLAEGRNPSGQPRPIAVDENDKVLISGITISGDVAVDSVTIDNTESNPVPVTGPLTDTQLRATALPVSGPLTDTELRAADVKITLDSEAVVLGAGTAAIGKLTAIPGLDVPAHDYIAMSYTGSDLTGVVYKTGGSSGTTVATLTLAYTGGNLTSVTKS